MEKYQPIDELAERAVLAGLLTSPESFLDVCDLVSAVDFGIDANRVLYQALVDCDALGKPVDHVTLTSFLRN